MNGSHSVHEVRGRRWRVLKSGCVKWTQRKSNLVQLRSVGLKACGLKSGLDRHLKQTGVLVKGVKREEQGDFDHCYLNARVDEKKTYPRQKRWVVCLRQRSCLPVVCSGAAVWVIIAVGGGRCQHVSSSIHKEYHFVLHNSFVPPHIVQGGCRCVDVLLHIYERSSGKHRKLLGMLKARAVTWNEWWNRSLFGLRWRCLDTLVFFYQGSGIGSVTGDRTRHS